jgi:site-specific DNA recombinase
MMDHLLTLTDQTEYPEGTAFEAIRQTIERIVVTPNGERTALDAVMTGRFAGIVRLWQEGESKDPAVGAAGSTMSVVAGAGFEPAAFRL